MSHLPTNSRCSSGATCVPPGTLKSSPFGRARHSFSANEYGVKVSALRVPGEKATDIGVVLYAIPGALLGIALVYLEGVRRERAERAHAEPV